MRLVGAALVLKKRAVQEARAQEAKAEDELNLKLKYKYVWWQPEL